MGFIGKIYEKNDTVMAGLGTNNNNNNLNESNIFEFTLSEGLDLNEIDNDIWKHLVLQVQ